jgi:hypothetical protein
MLFHGLSQRVFLIRPFLLARAHKHRLVVVLQFSNNPNEMETSTIFLAILCLFDLINDQITGKCQAKITVLRFITLCEASIFQIFGETVYSASTYPKSNNEDGCSKSPRNVDNILLFCRLC